MPHGCPVSFRTGRDDDVTSGFDVTSRTNACYGSVGVNHKGFAFSCSFAIAPALVDIVRKCSIGFVGIGVRLHDLTTDTDGVVESGNEQLITIAEDNVPFVVSGIG